MNPNAESIVVALVGFATAICLVLVYARVLRHADLLDPVVIFSVFLVIFVVPLPLRTLFTLQIKGDVTPHLPALLPYMAEAIWWTTAAYIAFALAYWSGLGRTLASIFPHPPILRGHRPLGAAAVILFVSLVLLITLGGGLAGIGDLILLGYASSAKTFGRGYLAVGFPWLIVSLLFLFYMYATHRTTRWLVYGLVGSAVLASMYLIMGNRSLVMYLLIALILFVHVQIRSFSKKQLLVLTVCGFVALNVYGFLRSSNYTSLTGYFHSTGNTLQLLQQSGKLDKGLYYTLTNGEFAVPFETMPQMIQSVGNTVPYQYGKTFLQAPLFFVPSALFPNRPLPLTNWYMNTFYGKTAGLNHGRAFFFLAEGYLNFGPIGVLLVGIMWGLYLSAIAEYRRRGIGNPGTAMIYSLAVAFIPRQIAGSFVTLLVALPEQSLGAAVIGIVAASLGAGWVWRLRVQRQQ